MNDPHVESLEFNLEIQDSLRFDNPKPLEGDAGGFTYRLADGVLTVTMKDHYPTAGEALEAVWPFIRAWELDYALTHGRRELWFTFVRPNIIDRNRTPDVLDSILLAGTATVTATGHAPTLVTTWRDYPAPPVDFRASQDLETLWTRYENQLLGREYLPAMGYFCLTVVEALYGATSGLTQTRKPSGKRTRTAKALNVELAVLEKLGELTTERGGPMMARKYEAGAPPRPLTAQEAAWIQAALRAIMRRVGMKAAGAAMPPLSMKHDLPSL